MLNLLRLNPHLPHRFQFPIIIKYRLHFIRINRIGTVTLSVTLDNFGVPWHDDVVAEDHECCESGDEDEHCGFELGWGNFGEDTLHEVHAFTWGEFFVEIDAHFFFLF